MGFSALTGCNYIGLSNSFESAASLDQAGKPAEAIQAYRGYLNLHPSTSLASRIYYRIARNYEAQSDYTDAIQWYQKILAGFPNTDEELHALLDLATLYHDQLKDPAKAMDYAQKAFNRYMENGQIRDAIQTLVDVQYSTADALFTQKNYKGSLETLGNIYKIFPMLFIPAATQAKIDDLSDRSRRAWEIAKASVDWIVLKSQIPFNKGYEVYFPASLQGDSVIPSPTGDFLAERKLASDGKYYLYVAKITPQSDQAEFKLLPQTFSAESPSWSEDGRNLVYWQKSGRTRRLLKTDVRTRSTQTLFYSRSGSLGIHPAYHPAGNKIAYVYAGKVCLQQTDGAGYKQLLKTSQNLDYTAELTWSSDGTMIRCRQANDRGKTADELLVLDVSAPNTP